jgi:hypothetical protein
MAASTVKVEGVIKRLGAIRQTGMVEGGFHLDFNVFHFPRIVIDLGVSGGKGS